MKNQVKYILYYFKSSLKYDKLNFRFISTLKKPLILKKRVLSTKGWCTRVKLDTECN